MTLALILFFSSIPFYTISQRWAFGRLKWMGKDRYGFWGEDSDKRKYKRRNNGSPLYAYHTVKKNWYTGLLNIKHKERWFTSTNLTISFTDGYHLCQAISHVLMACSFGSIYGWQIGVKVWVGIKLMHWIWLKITDKNENNN